MKKIQNISEYQILFGTLKQFFFHFHRNSWIYFRYAVILSLYNENDFCNSYLFNQVETVGDVQLVVSGVPNRNARLHAGIYMYNISTTNIGGEYTV